MRSKCCRNRGLLMLIEHIQEKTTVDNSAIPFFTGARASRIPVLSPEWHRNRGIHPSSTAVAGPLSTRPRNTSASLHLSRYTRALQQKTEAHSRLLDPSEPLSSSPRRLKRFALRLDPRLSKHRLAAATFPTDFWWRCELLLLAPAQPELAFSEPECRRDAGWLHAGGPPGTEESSSSCSTVYSLLAKTRPRKLTALSRGPRFIIGLDILRLDHTQRMRYHH